MNLFPPDPEFTLYETGFDEADPFNRKATGVDLSGLVDRITDPLVIAVDGEWGCGKTWFLKRWVGAHRAQNGGKARTIYFDAFAHDFLDDPLIGLTGVIGERLSGAPERRLWDRVKAAAAKLGRPAARIALAVTTAGISEGGGVVADAAAEAVRHQVEESVEAFWQREDGRRGAMAHLREALTEATRPDRDGAGPLVVVVDELDRCRPDYALALLEVAKHFFSVPRVHFVLGVKLHALEHSVRQRYGAGIDAERYLRRFVTLTMRLPDTLAGGGDQPLIPQYFHDKALRMGLTPHLVHLVKPHVQLIAGTRTVTMRDVNRLLAELALLDVPRLFQISEEWREILVSMLLFRVLQPDLEARALRGACTFKEVFDFYGIAAHHLSKDDTARYDQTARLVSRLWGIILGAFDGSPQDKAKLTDRLNGGFGGDLQSHLRRFHAAHLSTFTLPPP